MDSVVATVTGYHGSERFNLIKLISHAGASYIGAMSPSITHLVCWRFEGKKYELAQKFGTKVVNHRWVEDCINKGRRVLEDPYMRQSGEEVGPLVLEVPAVAEADSLKKKRKVLSDRSNICGNSGKEVFDAGYVGSDLWAWVKSPSLDEDLLPPLGRSKGGSDKLRSKSVRRASKEVNLSSSRKVRESSLSGGSRGKKHEEPRSPIQSLWGKSRSVKNEESKFQSSMEPPKQGKNIYNDTKGRFLAESLRRGRRLVKKNVDRVNLDTESVDTFQNCHQTVVPEQHIKATPPSIHPLDERNVDICDLEGTSDHNYRGIIHIDDDIEDFRVLSPSPVSKNSSSSAKDAAFASTRISEGCFDSENINMENQDGSQTEHGTRIPFSMELSCVICLTEFSPTRGVLPCGHRFCYECIQSWADRMTAKRKVSLCPLCNRSFTSITKVLDAAATDQKIYSQTIPCSTSTTDVIFLPNMERSSFASQSLASGCINCRSREPEDLLISCDICQLRKVHIYCLDPVVSPWICIHCKDLPMLLH